MKVLITGASGFLGSWLTRVLSIEYQVCALTRETSNLYKISDLQGIQIVQLKSNFWVNFIKEFRPDVLILNDWSGVGNRNKNDLEQSENVSRIHQLVLAAKNSGVKVIIGVGSQAELGPISSSISETAPDRPTTIYGRAKIETRLVLQKELSGTDIRFIWMRIFSTYGPLDDGSWLIPNMVDSLSINKQFKMTKGEQEWSYLHAYDLALAFATVIQDLGINGIVNVGNPQVISIREAGLTIGKLLKKERFLEFGALDYQSDQIMRLQPLCETLTNTGWYPKISFEQGIKQTIEWLQRKQLSEINTIRGEVVTFNLPVRP